MIKLVKKIFNLIPRNFILNVRCASISFSELVMLSGIQVKQVNFSSEQYTKWLEKNYPFWEKDFKEKRHKKLIEFFTTYTLLEIKKR